MASLASLSSRRMLIILAGIAAAFVVIGSIVVLERSRHPMTHLHPGDSLKAAVAVASPGTTITLATGSYGQLQLQHWNWQKPITITAATGQHPTLSDVNLNDVHGLTLDHLDVAGAYQAQGSGELALTNSHAGKGVHLRDGTDTVTIARNRLDGGDYGVWVWNSATSARNRHITISSNDISGQTSDNIQIGAADDLVIEDNVLHDIADDADHNDGIQLMGSQGAVIRRNRISVQDEGILLKAESYLGPDNRVANVRVENNLVTKERGAGIIVAGSADAQIVNNTIWDNHLADLNIVGDNPGLRMWNNIAREIYKPDMQPAQDAHNCAETVLPHNNGDTIGSVAFADPSGSSDFHLADNSPCAGVAIADGAPSNDLGGNPRSAPITTGAWQRTG